MDKGRKTKKKQENLYRLGDGERILFSYLEKRKIDRIIHASSIEYARHTHVNYWVMNRIIKRYDF